MRRTYKARGKGKGDQNKSKGLKYSTTFYVGGMLLFFLVSSILFVAHNFNFRA